MKYGRIAGNDSVNELIYRCFDHICEEDVSKFVKRFREQPHDEAQVLHTFRELILGAYLGSRGFRIRYAQQVAGKTPDWCIMDQASAVQCVVELVNFHIDKDTEEAMQQKFGAGDAFGRWVQSNVPRLYQRIADKARAYRALVTACGVAYVIAVFGMLVANVKPKEVEQCLFEQGLDIFGHYREVSGVLFFQEGRYRFFYMANPKALRTMDLPSGELRL
jgi:hypothetical protein